MFIGVFVFRGLTEGPACLLEFLFFADKQKVPLVYWSFCFSRVNKRSRLFIGVFVFSRVNRRSHLFIRVFVSRGLTEGHACLLEFLFFAG